MLTKRIYIKMCGIRVTTLYRALSSALLGKTYGYADRNPSLI